MDKLLLGDAERYTRAHRRKRRWYQVTTCLAAVVVFCTTYALILPAITLEKQCALPEHTHTEACYTSEQGDLICTQSTEPQHTHTEECYQETQALVCGMEESTGHTHGAECYDEEGNLICGQEESEGHVHGEACYEASRQLICGQTEEPAHQHTEECYSWNQVLTCGMEEHTHSEACTATEPEEPVFCGKEPHTHGEDCRDEQGELTCTLEEHTHSLACYADPGADVETAEIWEQTFGDVTLTGDWRLDALAIAQSQLGYAESTKNYALAEDGQTLMGYTRYGAWQGDPYGHWNAMFVAFCLHYGGAENVPTDKDCGSWAAALADAFLPAQSHEAAPGDLVFFDRDGDGTADRVAIVAEVTAGEEVAPSGFTAIEGDVDHAVQQCSYAVEDSTILGYGSLPEQAKTFTLTAQTGSGITVTVTGDSAFLPFPASEITLTAADVAEEQGQAIREQLPAEEDTEPEQRFLLDISLWHGEEEIEPVGPVTVTFSGLDTEGLYPKVYHIDTEAQEVTDMEAIKDEAGVITMSTEHFSLYALQFRAAADINGSQLGDIANGGSFRLTSDATWNDTITITQDTDLDLNGCGVCYQGTGSFLVVSSDATLTIMDSKPPEEKPVTPGDGSLYGNKASLENDTLTYYITESEANGTGTTETLIKHEVPLANAGKILCKEGSDQVIKVETGGTLELLSGVLQGAGVKHIVYVEDGTLNVSGGYIVGGGSDDRPGGGIFVTGGAENGTVNIQGGVVAANRGNFGGGIYVESGTLNISGGAVTGNEVFNGHEDNGGGIYVSSGTLNLSGNGYVTNNSKDCTCAECQGDKNNTHGGGGIALANGTTMNMSGGYVTGNYSSLAGGGIYAGFYEGDGGVNFSMTGGTIAANCARYGEGGGLRIGGGTNGVIRADEKVYITNNQTLTTDDWGGGGIFVQQNGLLTVADALITDNFADGFGGGVGACPTGETLIVNKDGAAIYENRANGDRMSGGGNNKTYDTDLAKASKVFMANGYTDYFCVRAKEGANNYISLVTGLMAGGGAANWKGSCDEKPVKIGRTGYAAAKYLFGLEAHPDESAKNDAVTTAKVMITGNSSGVHGGGIMTNGGLILGDPKGTVVTATPELDITGTKVLRKDGEPQESGRNFQFQLKGSTDTDVRTATANGTTGVFTFQDIDFSEAGTYTYYLTEDNDGRPGVAYDSSTYKIDVTVQSKTETLAGVTFTRYYVGNVTVTKTGGNTPDSGETVSNNNTFKIHFNNGDNWSKVCLYTWNSGEIPSSESWPGEQVSMDSNSGWYTKEFTVTDEGNFNYIFNGGVGGKQTNDLTGHYQPGGDLWVYWDGTSATTTTTAPDGWNGSSSGSNVSFTGTPDSEGSYTLTINGAAFTNTMTTQVNFQIVKTDSMNAEIKLEGATFTLKEQGKENSVEVPTGKDGIATFTGIRRNTTYYLYETKAPSNYMTAGPWILEVKESTATLYPATEGENGALTQTSDTGTPLEGSDSDPIVFSATISDQSWGYKLPDTGGAGTTSYTTGGLVLIFGAATLLYIQCKRRKEDETSS